MTAHRLCCMLSGTEREMSTLRMCSTLGLALSGSLCPGSKTSWDVPAQAPIVLVVVKACFDLSDGLRCRLWRYNRPCDCYGSCRYAPLGPRDYPNDIVLVDPLTVPKLLEIAAHLLPPAPCCIRNCAGREVSALGMCSTLGLALGGSLCTSSRTHFVGCGRLGFGCVAAFIWAACEQTACHTTEEGEESAVFRISAQFIARWQCRNRATLRDLSSRLTRLARHAADCSITSSEVVATVILVVFEARFDFRHWGWCRSGSSWSGGDNWCWRRWWGDNWCWRCWWGDNWCWRLCWRLWFNNRLRRW